MERLKQTVIVIFQRVDWSGHVRTRIAEALEKRSGREAWLTGNVVVSGGNDAGEHVVRRRLDSVDTTELRDSGTTTCSIPPLFKMVDAAGAQQITVRFKVEISGGPGLELVGKPIVQILRHPFHRPAATTPAPTAAGPSPYELMWEAKNPRVERAKRTKGPYPLARNLTTTAVRNKPPNCWQYNPVHKDTLVVDRTEYDTGHSIKLTNWHGWDPRENNGPLGGGLYKSLAHPPKVYGYRLHGDTSARGRKKTICRDLSEIKTIMLHETAGWGMDDPLYMPRKWRTSEQIGTQFNVTTDGRIFQYYDAVQRVSHISAKRNDDGVGIEFSNIVYATPGPTGEFTPPSRANDHTTRRTVKWWGYGSKKYIVPPLAQMEALFELVQLLLTILPSVPGKFRALDAHGEAGAPDEKLFLMSRWTSVYDTDSLPGMYSHHNVKDHVDGSFQSLYLWLRTQADVSSYDGSTRAEKAYNAAIDLTDNHQVRHSCGVGSDKKDRFFVNVKDVHP